MNCQTTQRRSEDGAVLFLALIFLGVVGLIGAALISSEFAVNRQSFSARRVQLRETGTNTGLEWAVNSLRQGKDGFCQGTYTRQLLTVGGREVEVICKGSNSSLGLNSFALYLNSASPASQSQVSTNGAVGASPVKNIVGPVYNARGSNGWDLKAPLKVDGEVLIPSGDATCTAAGTAPPASNLQALYTTMNCKTVPLSAVTPPAVPTPCPGACTNPAALSYDAAGVITAGAASCKVFSPGYYSVAPDLAGTNFFKPGVYYFDYNKIWSIGSAIRGGDPAPATANVAAEQVRSTIVKCPGAPAAVAPYGVTFVFGQGATLKVTNNGRIELFSNVSGGGRLPNITTGNLAGVTAWGAASNVPLSKDLFSVGVAQPEFVLHSGVFAPDSGFSLKGSNNALETIRNTVVVGRFDMQASASITNANFGIIVPAGAEKKYVLMARSCPGSLKNLTVNACTVAFVGSGSNPAEPELCTLASLKIYGDDARTVYLDNWRVDRDATASDPATCSTGYVVP
jgi:hypothetical protein